MKTRNVFLWLFVLLTTTAFGQNLIISCPDYAPKDGTNDPNGVNVRPGTVLTITATLPSGATSTYWTASDSVKVTIPAKLNFPVTLMPGNQIVFTMPAIYQDIIITVLFNTGQTSWIKLIRNINVVDGLLSLQQNIQDCPDVNSNYAATTPFQTGFTYTWQEWNGTAWGSLNASSYYSPVTHVLNIQTHSSIQGKRFRAMVKNDNCLGAIDYTAEVVVQTVYALPNNQIPTINGSDVSVHTVLDRGECQSTTVIGLKSSQTNVNYQLRLYDAPYTLLDTQSGTDGVAITFAPQPGMICKIIAVSSNGCEREIVKE